MFPHAWMCMEEAHGTKHGIDASHWVLVAGAS